MTPPSGPDRRRATGPVDGPPATQRDERTAATAAANRPTAILFSLPVGVASVLVPLLGFVAGLALLVAGADRAVRNAGELALYYGVSTFFVGVTLISIGTSVPEMTTSIYGAWYGAGDIVVGNIVGSETAQITLAVGVVALIAPIETRRRNVIIYGGGMVLAMIIMALTLEDGVVGLSEGFLMMIAYAIFVHDLYSHEGGAEIAEEALEEREPPRESIPWIVVGLAGVVVGGQLTVTSGIRLAGVLGVPEFLLGLLTGLGTTLPEIVVAGVAARGGDHGISVGALLGSNITDPVFSLGVGALVAPVVVSDLPAAMTGVRYMLAVSAVVLAWLYWRRGMSRRAGVAAILLYLPSFGLV